MSSKNICRRINLRAAPDDIDEETREHLMACDSCRRFLDLENSLQTAMRVLRDEAVPLGPSLEVERRVLAEFNSQGLRRAGPTTRQWHAAAVMLLFIFALSPLLFMIHHQKSTSVGRSEEIAFTEMPYVIPPAPYERTSVVRTEVPIGIIVAAGFQVRDPYPSSGALADVVLGEDGRVLAIRLVSELGDSSPVRSN